MDVSSHADNMYNFHEERNERGEKNGVLGNGLTKCDNDGSRPLSLLWAC